MVTVSYWHWSQWTPHAHQGVGRAMKSSLLPSAPHCPAANPEETFPASVMGPCGDLHPLTPLQLIHPHDLSASTRVTLTLPSLWHGSAFKMVMIWKASLLGLSCDYKICHRPEGVINTSGHWDPTRDKTWEPLCQTTYWLPLGSNFLFSFTYKSTWWGDSYQRRMRSSQPLAKQFSKLPLMSGTKTKAHTSEWMVIGTLSDLNSDNCCVIAQYKQKRMYK